MGCIFCQLVNGEKKNHANGYPFEILRETKDTIAFLSIVLPMTEDGHILIIPKDHYANVEDIPKIVLNQLIGQVSVLTKILRTKHGGCNVLLNDGVVAGQTVFHSHFHILPRDKGDKIKIEVYKCKKMNKKEFLYLQQNIKQMCEQYSNYPSLTVN
jgi:histidine triad (HIT) family protein